MMYLKRLIPRDKADKFGVSATIFLLLLVTWNNISKLSKISNEYPTYSLAMLITGLYVLFNVFGNMYKAISVDTTIYSINLPIQLMEGWRYCSGSKIKTRISYTVLKLEIFFKINLHRFIEFGIFYIINEI